MIEQSYNRKISELQNPTFQQIVDIAKRCCGKLCTGKQNCKPWSILNHGVDLLDSHEKLCNYLCAYGDMHEEKMFYAFDAIDNPHEVFNREMTIVDWGCGQGLATLCFFDFLNNKKIPNKTRKVILVEPSEDALNRAKLHVRTYLKDSASIVTRNKFINDVVEADLKSETPVVLHFFSNILDIPSIDLKKLAQKIAVDTSKDHFFFCTAPLNYGNKRIEVFYDYFESHKILAEEEHSSLPKTKKTLKLLVFKLEAGKTQLIQVKYYPPVQFHAAYQLDAVKNSIKDLTNEERYKHELLSTFNVSTPFDIGASIYDDVQPIFAVINNIITRGLSTRTSPFIENVFAALGNQKVEDDLGNIKFANTKLQTDKLFDSVEYLSPIAIARVQKTILEALMTTKISVTDAKWHILVIERDVPCAAIAFEDLKQMFYHLSGLSKEHEHIILPPITLEIISTPRYVDSPLHLNTSTSIEPNSQQKLTDYDMVIDVSLLPYNNMDVQFSEFRCKNNCYFNIRSAVTKRSNRHIYTSDTIDYKPLVTKNAQGVYNELSDTKLHLQYFLQLLFRKEDFRPGQLPILDRALQNKSVIGLLPTGGGKSLTYQLAAMLQPGVTIIIDPLRSLMKDQYDGLINAGIDTCSFINSTQSTSEKKLKERQMVSSQLQFVFMSPERLSIYEFRQRLKTMRETNVYFAYGVIDEVHCVSEWGHDFRFSYLHLGRNLYNYVLPKNEDKHLTLFGLTATASFDVLADVERELSGNGAFPLDSETIIRYENTNRLELHYKVERVPVEYETDRFFDTNGLLNPQLPKAVNIADKWAVFNSKKQYLKEYIPKIADLVNSLQTDNSIEIIKNRTKLRQNNDNINGFHDLKCDFENSFFLSDGEYTQSGIVFCPHKKNTGISVEKNAENLSEFVSKVGTFMGSSNNDSDEDDDSSKIDDISFYNLEEFRNNRLPLMIATKAFGMGIDKPNVRFTVNLNMSSSLEGFIQEAGRAGRDKRTALAVILFADYSLIRINRNCPINKFPMGIIKNKWFKEDDLKKILAFYKLDVDYQYFDFFTPQNDLVKLRCAVSNQIFAFGDCLHNCDQASNCKLKDVPQEMKGFQFYHDLIDNFKNVGQEIPKDNLEFISADYETVMYFYNKNFKGSLIEMQKMREILSHCETKYFFDDNEEIKVDEIESIDNFLSKLLSVEAGTEIVAFVSYNNNYVDYAKAIYRMSCIELIDDFTQDYVNQRFRIVTIRKEDGDYYKSLKKFLMRYYSADKAEIETQKAMLMKADNEIFNCLEFLTDFIYDKIAVKRKRAIDDMRSFCIQGLDQSKDWKEVNEDLKDFIYYYFNSKYAKDNYTGNNGELFSLTLDTDFGKGKDLRFTPEIVMKYMRVIDLDDPAFGPGETPKDNVKHLHGAVRLIRRSLTGINPALDLLNAFCLFYLGTNNNNILEKELHNSYYDGLIGFSKTMGNYSDFWVFFDEFHDSITKKAKEYPIENLYDLKNETVAQIHANIVRSLTNNYTKE